MPTTKNIERQMVFVFNNELNKIYFRVYSLNAPQKQSCIWVRGFELENERNSIKQSHVQVDCTFAGASSGPIAPLFNIH